MNFQFENTKSIGDVIKELVRNFNLSPKLDEASVVRDWAKIVGSATAKYTSEVLLKNGNLTVKLTSAALRKELMMNRSKLINVVNKYYGKEIVKSIDFR